MPNLGNDISKCEGKECPLRDTCYRYTVKADEFMQAYGSYWRDLEEKNKCKYYWEDE